MLWKLLGKRHTHLNAKRVQKLTEMRGWKILIATMYARISIERENVAIYREEVFCEKENQLVSWKL